MTTISNSKEVTQRTYLPEQSGSKSASQVKSVKTDGGLKEGQSLSPKPINDSLGHVLRSLQIVASLKDTTGAILEKMRAQMEEKGITPAKLNPAGANSKSLQVSQQISLQGDKGLVQQNREFLRQIQG
jgi:hypothetical protein